MSADITLSRTEFLGLLTGQAGAPSRRVEETVEQLRFSHATIAISTSSSQSSMWVGADHTTLAVGDDPVVLRRIRMPNTPLAVLDLLLGHRADRPTGWWSVIIATDSAAKRVEGFMRASGEMWLQTEREHSTSVAPASTGQVAARVCAALRPVIGPAISI